MHTTMSSEKAALETLVIWQLAEIRKCESELQKRMSHSSLSAKSTDQASFGEELWQLQQRTDRLNRMMDAMGGCSGKFV